MLESLRTFFSTVDPRLLAPLLAGLVAGCVLLFVSSRSRGSRRRTMQLLGFWLLFPTMLAAIFVVFSGLGSAEMGTALGVSGILVSFVFGVLGSPSSFFLARPMKVAVLFMSRGAFHREIRQGLHEQLALIGANVIDFGMESSSEEDELGFLRLLRRIEKLRPDFAVIWAPGKAWTDEPEVIAFATALYREGGLCIFLENSPHEDLQQKTLTIVHDAEMGGRYQGRLARQFGAGTTRSTLVLLGPEYSKPAVGRNTALREELSELELVTYLQLFSWGGLGALDQLRKIDRANGGFDIVVCPNDSIALALEDASKNEDGLSWLAKADVLGFDGLPRARACVAENGLTIKGTVSIPPSEFGARAGLAILRLSNQTFSLRSPRRDICGEIKLPISDKHIITRGRARAQLYD